MKLPIALSGMLVLGTFAVSPTSGQEIPGLAGRPVAEALDLLRSQGLRIIYSSDLVPDELVVAEEPETGSLYETLQAILEPHGLTTEVGPHGTLLVVRRRRARPLRVSVSAPEEGAVAVGRVTIAADVAGDEPVESVDFFVDGVRVGRREDPPYRVVAEVGDAADARTFRVVARGRRGGVAESSVTSRRVEVREGVEVALRQIYVSAFRNGDPATDLEREDFVLLDDGRRQSLVTFARGEMPLSAVVLVDASESMRGRGLAAAVEGTRSFVGGMALLDEATVIFFADRPVATVPFPGDPAGLLPVIDRIEAEGGTALHDALYVALSDLDDRLGRRAVILLSDGTDVLSVLSMADVLWKLRRTDAVLYWIRLQDGRGPRQTISSSWRDAAAHRRELELLGEAVVDSGGRVETLERIEEADPAFRRILEELRGQYALGYYPTRRHDGAWRPVEVRVDPPGVELRYRPGYVDR